MKSRHLILLIPFIMLLNGCAAMISSEHRVGHHRQSRVSVGVHGNASGGALGAMIVGGIIGAVINEASHESEKKEAEEKVLREKQLKKSKLESEEMADRERLNRQATPVNEIKPTQWYQVGKDGQCYQMQTVSGITDVVGSVDPSNCEN